MSTLRREIQTEVKILDASKGLCRYVASDQTLDYSREIILARGWKFTNFQANAPFVDSHDYSTLERQLGKVVRYAVEGDQLIEDVQWAIDVPENRLAILGWKMVMGGYLKACSVGFVPAKYLTRWDTDPTAYVQQLAALGLASASEEKKPRVIYVEQEQIELSACLIGCNPSALLKSYQDGAVGEEDLFNAGFKTDTDFDFLTKSAAVFDALPEEGRAVVHAALARIFGSAETPLQKRKEPKAEPAAKPAGAKGSHDRQTLEALFGEFNKFLPGKNQNQ